MQEITARPLYFLFRNESYKMCHHLLALYAVTNQSFYKKALNGENWQRVKNYMIHF